MTINNTIINKDMIVTTIENKIKDGVKLVKEIKETYDSLKEHLTVIDTTYEDKSTETIKFTWKEV